MTIDLFKENNVTIAVTPAQLKEFALCIVDEALENYRPQSTTTTPETYLTTEETMNRLHISRATLWRWRESGYLCPIKVGKFTRYKESDIKIVEQGGGGV